MLHTTDAIVLSLQPHSDKAQVLHAYTRTGGRVNYMVYGIGRKNPRGLYAPFSLVQITADHSPNRPPTVKETTGVYSPYSEMDYTKQTVALFLSEVLYHTLRYPMEDKQLFEFIASSVRQLDSNPNFHIHFLVNLAAKLGFAIPEDSNLKRQTTTNDIQQLLTRTERQKALKALCEYYAEHVETWQTPKSLDVLMEVFD